ncbi:cadherin-like domain-containing protein [Aliarcobacter cryaerophilus]|uniref:Calx-beta domain-containing protein n=1 Tax=Aliarcobacter cryaerophilus TaxID=28198 RepID=UPI0021B3F3BF|nr:Calx-beta domain-containing protein [Aliarcobacter cryaerophilus]MCT7433311.1 cadherin-like domain-containing protein [Aliarcobacter cryaerophilus]
MASKVGIVESINDGKFFAKDSLGNTKELKNGDIIYENDVVFSDGSNSSNSEIRVALEGEDIIVLKNGVQQLFDSSLIASTFGDEEVVFTRKGLEALLQQAGDMTNVESDLRWASFDNYVDITEEETTAGEEEEEILEEGSIGQFASRDGDITDIVSDLRKKSWIRTQNYKEVENSEALEKTSLKPLGENLDTIVSIPRPIAPNPIDTIIPIAPTPVPPTPETPIITPIITPIANLSIDDITMYEQDGFMVFTVTLDIPASGNITVNFATSNGTAEAGKDYTPITGIITIPSGSSTAQIRVPINDDYYYEKSETFNVTLTNPTGNVNIVKPVGVGTILDNPPANNKPLDPNKPDSETGTYGEEDSVYAIITGSTTVKEGDKANYTVQIIDKDGNPVVVTKDTKVTVVYKNITTSDDTEYKDSEYIKKDIIIKAGTSKSEIFDVETKDDYLADNGEKFKLEITQIESTGEFENVVIGDKNGNQKDITTEILDNSNPKDPTNPGINPNDKVNNPNNPSSTEENQESVILKIVALDKDGNPVFEADGKTYKTVNEVNEGNSAKYMVLAFEPNTTEFTTDTVLANNLQGGTVTIKTADGTAVTTGFEDFATKDYEAQTNKTVTLGQSFEVKTLDDYIADNNENYTVLINDKSYAHPATPIYENVVTDKDPVTTTILDNSNPKDSSTPHNPNTPNDPTNPHNTETNGKDIVVIKLFAADKDGNVLKDIDGNYLLANKAEEGTTAKYIAYAFKDGETTFNDSTKLKNQTGTVDIQFQNGTATGSTTGDTTDTTGTKDFNNTSKSITLGTAFSTEVFKDSTDEGDENYTVTIKDGSYTGNYESVEIDTNPVTTTIFDEMIFVKIVAITPETNEGGNLKYKVVLVNSSGDEVKVPAGKNLVVNLAYTGNTSKPADDTTDYTPVITVKIDGGNSSKEFEVETKDDYYAEGDEGLKITITSTDNNTSNAFNKNVNLHTLANGAPSDAIEVIGTIKDNPSKINQPDNSTEIDNPTNGSYGQEDTVYAIITGTQTIKEGNISTNYTVKLVDKDGNTVTPTKDTKITVTYNHYTDGKPTQDDDTQYNNGDTIEVTILANQTEATFTVQTNDDVYKDDGEQFNLTITNIQNTGEFENIKIGDKDGNQKNVITTIEDNTTTGTETDIDLVKIILVALEKGQTLVDITDTDGKLIYKNTNTTPESGELSYIAVAVDSENKVLVQSGKVTVNTANGTAIAGTSTTPPLNGSEDYKSLVNQSVNIGEVFKVKTNDDYVRDNNETFTVKITNVVDTNYESPSIDTTKDTVTSTITDNPAQDTENPKTPIEPTDPNNPNDTTKKYGEEDTVYVKITETPSTVEGGDLVHTITLVDKNGDLVTVPAGQTVTVNLTYSANSGSFTESDLSTIVKFVTFNGGESSKNFTNTTKDDFTYEGDEVYNVTISSVTQSGAFENVVIGDKDGNYKSTTGTIKDGVTIYKDGAYIDPENAIVDEDKFDVTNPNTKISNKDGNASDGTNTYQGQYLNIIKPNTDNNYSLIFDGNPTVYKGDKDSGIAFDYGDSRGTSLQSGGVVIEYVVNGNTITGYKGTGRNAADKVFDIVLNKDSSILSGSTTKDSYTYTQYKNIDHPKSGDATDPTNDDNITFEFGFKITDQDSESDVVKFKVTVNDSIPETQNKEVGLNEDGTLKIVISPENFKGGEIKIKVNGDSDYTTLSNGQTKNVTDPNDSTKVVGVLKNNGDGTVTFTPSADYSNYATKPWFEYAVSDFDGDTAAARVSINVKPVADAPTIFVKDVTTTEDDGNTKEGTNKVDLELKVPFLSKDSDKDYSSETTTGYTAKQNSNQNAVPTLTPSGDKNNGVTGDNPERNGEITLTFTNGDKLKNIDGTVGAKIFKADGTTQIGTDITTANQPLKVIIVNDGKTDVDYTYHHKNLITGTFDINNPPAGTVYLTKSEYEALKIQHAEDNDTDIKITIKVTSYEVDDSGIPLDKTTYGNQVESTTTADMIVKIQPMTDDIKLEFNDTNVKYFEKKTDGTFVEKTIIGSKTRSDKDTNIDNVEDTFTFTNKISEGSGEINLNSILSNTSGALNGTGGTKGDLDGSEKRTYTITGIPEGTIVKIGDTEAIAGKDGKATLTFKDAENKDPDPSFTMKFPEHFGGGVKATIKLSVYDKGVDSTDTAGAVKTQTVYLNIDVEPVATTPDLNTFQVAQAIGYEDAGRSKGNDLNANANIDQPAKGIPLNIKVSSTDTDGSETANVKITNIPSGAKLYYDGTEVTANGSSEYIITNFDNSKSLVYIPPFNDDTDAKLKVQVQFVDTVTYNDNSTKTEIGNWSTTKDIDVIVKNVADAPVGIDLKADINVDEDNELNLQDIYSNTINSSNFKSTDDSEELTVKIKLPDGFTIKEGSPYFIDDGEYVVKASDIIAGNIKIVPPKDFSGSASFNLTYVTTEKAGENDSKTLHPQTVNIFVNPKADDVNTTNSTTMYEDIATKVDLTATLKDSGTTNGTETIDAVYVSKATIEAMITQGYTINVNGANINTKTLETITPEGKTNEQYYVLTHAEANQITVINSVEHKINGDFTLNVAYKVTDTNNAVSDTKIYGHTHTVTVKAVTDQPTISVVSGSTPNAETVGTIGVKDSGEGVGIYNNGSKIVVWQKGTEFTVLVKSESPDNDGSEEIQRIEIHGVPKGVIVDGAVFKGYTGNDWGVWVIENPSDKILNSDGASLNIKFSITDGANFTGRDMTIKTITKDINAEEKSASTNVRMDMEYTYDQGGTGSTPDYELVIKTPTIEEEKPFTLKDLYGVSYTTGTVHGSSWAADFTNLPEGTIFRVKEGQTGVNIYTYTDSTGKLHYVISGINQNKEDIESVFEKIEIITPKDINSDQVGILKGDFSITGTISSTNGAYSHQGTEQKFIDYRINPVTDEMTIAINVANTDEDTETPITITLSNPSDGTKTALIGNSITIKVSETWKDLATGGVGTKGTLTDLSGKYNVVYNSGDDTYTITPKNPVNNFKVDTPITGLVYTPATNRDGDVKFEVSVQNKEGNSVTLTSKGDTTIKVTPVIDMKPEVTVVTATGIEDEKIVGINLDNPVKLNVSTTISADSSEKFTNIVLDEVLNGFTVWYKDGANLVMATNIGKTGGADFDLTPNISTDALTHRNKWLVPVDTSGAMPEIYINAPTNWAGDFEFKAQFTLKEQNLTTTEKIVVDVTGKIIPVADGVTIDPTLTFGKAFEWIDLKLNANMKDVDGSETMSLELSGLGANAQFRINGTDTLVSAEYSSEKWTITGIAFDQINNIQFTNDKAVETVNVKAWTQEIDKDGKPLTGTDAESSKVDSTFKLDLKDVGGILELDKGINLDFSKLETTSLKGINSIDLSKDGKNKLENLKLSDVLSMTNNKGELIIKGDNQDEVSFKKNDGWNKGSTTETIGGKIFDIYSNSGDNSVKVKVEQAITDGITS